MATNFIAGSIFNVESTIIDFVRQTIDHKKELSSLSYRPTMLLEVLKDMSAEKQNDDDYKISEIKCKLQQYFPGEHFPWLTEGWIGKTLSRMFDFDAGKSRRTRTEYGTTHV